MDRVSNERSTEARENDEQVAPAAPPVQDAADQPDPALQSVVQDADKPDTSLISEMTKALKPGDRRYVIIRDSDS